MIAAGGAGYRQRPYSTISGCPALAPVEYKHRPDQVAKIVHQELAVKYGLLTEKVPYYQDAPANVLQKRDVTLYWDRSILTDKTTRHNRPDIVLRNHKSNHLSILRSRARTAQPAKHSRGKSIKIRGAGAIGERRVASREGDFHPRGYLGKGSSFKIYASGD